MKPVKKKLPPNPYAKNNRVDARFNTEEMQVAMKKALLYFGGNMSELVREAVLTYTGKKSVK